MADIQTINGNVVLYTDTRNTAMPLSVSRTDVSIPNNPLAQITFFGAGTNNLQGVLSFSTMNSGNANGPLQERMRIHTNGSVGIGVNAPVEKLEVDGKVKATAFVGDGSALTGVNDASKVSKGGDTMAGRLILPTNGLTVGTDQLVIANGSVGIGTTDPQAKLQVVGGAIMPSAGSTENTGLLFPKDPGGGAGDRAWIRYYPRTDESMTLEIGISNDPDDHIALMPSGNVGIGTTAPQAKLQVVGGAIMPSAGSTENTGLLFPKDPGGGALDRAWIRYYPRTGESMTLEIGISNDPDDHIALVPSGNVGIGTNSPANKLDVNGGAYLGYETSVSDFGAPLKSGFYQNTGTKITGDVPDPAHPWTHLITARHSNTSNNHQLQIATSYAYNDKLYFRKIAAGGTANPAWNEIATRGSNGFTGDQSITGALTVSGIVTMGANPVRFTSGWSGFPDSATNQAEISNDTGGYKTLMIVGNKSAGLGRRVSIWDRLEVNGTLDVNGGAYLGYETSVSDFGVPLKSGFYQNGGAKITGDVPDPAHPWTHLITARHSNTSNNHQLQIAASYAYNDKLYFRKIAAGGTANPTWNEIATRGSNVFKGDQWIEGNIRNSSDMHIIGNDHLFLDPKNGVIIGKTWGGNGLLTVGWRIIVEGDIYYSGLLQRSSSQELKDNIRDLASESAHKILDGLKPVSFSLKSDIQPSSYLGFIAEDVPEEVGAADRRSVNSDHIVAVLTRVLKDQQQTIVRLEKRIALLEGAA